MVSLARSTLIHDWRRYSAAIVAIAFAGVLMLVQTGTLLGVFRTITVVLEYSAAELWVSSPVAPAFDLGIDFRASTELRFRLHPDIVATERIRAQYGNIRSADGGRIITMIVGFDLAEAGMALPPPFRGRLREALQEPFTAVVDESDLAQVKAKVGDSIEVNGRSVRIVGAVRGYRNISGMYLFCSMNTAKRLLFAPNEVTEMTSFILAKVRPGVSPEKLRDELQADPQGLKYRVWTSDEFTTASQLYWLLRSGAGAGFMVTLLAGFLVGVTITVQTLRAAVLSTIREYATLRAMGISVRALRTVVLEQAGWLGVCGLVLTLIISHLCAWAASQVDFAIPLPWWSMLITVCFVVALVLFAGFMSIKSLYKAEPALLLR
jgi:putative ABC transport system permease protein